MVKRINVQSKVVQREKRAGHKSTKQRNYSEYEKSHGSKALSQYRVSLANSIFLDEPVFLTRKPGKFWVTMATATGLSVLGYKQRRELENSGYFDWRIKV